MLHYMTGTGLRHHLDLAATMARDRRAHFGADQDGYDRLNPIHVIWQGPDGGQGASMRFLPTLGRTGVNDRFAHLCGGRRFAHAKMWEFSQICLPPGASPDIAACLMLGAAELGIGFGLSRAVGVVDLGQMRLFQQLGWLPVVLGVEGRGPDEITLGLWQFSGDLRRRLAKRAGIAEPLSRLWFDQAFGGKKPAAATG
jgi:acyl homoserine lactone synthase